MEYLRGESLFERLQRGEIALPEALRFLDQVARGLEAAHAQGVTHRDLKPDNIYLVHLPGEPPMVKLLDFGLAKLRADVDDDRDQSERTQSGVAIGTPMYMSPEQARGPDVDPRTDIYALGCVAYELVLGCRPFPHAKTPPEMWAAHLHEAPQLPRSVWSEIPPQLDLVLFAMLAKDPEHRPTLTQVRAVLAAIRTDATQRAATELVVPRERPSRQTLSITVIAVAIVLLAGGILIGSRLTPHTDHHNEPVRSTLITAPKITPIEPPPAPTTPLASVPVAPTHGTLSASPPKHAVLPHLPRTSTTPLRTSDAALGSAATRDMRPIVTTESVSTGSAVPIGQTKDPFVPIDRNQTVNPFAHKATP